MRTLENYFRDHWEMRNVGINVSFVKSLFNRAEAASMWFSRLQGNLTPTAGESSSRNGERGLPQKLAARGWLFWHRQILNCVGRRGG